MLKTLKNYRYEIIAALSGATVMILELVGARMMAPFFGTSTYVWTAMIGVILGALSFGYWYGGRLADKGASDKGLMVILAGAALITAMALIVQARVLPAIASWGLDVRVSAVFSALVLFAPASALLGIVSPYVAKLKLSSLKTAGSSIGRLYAAGTLGSIAGTFLTGYWLIAVFGNFMLGVIVVVALVGISFVAERRTFLVARCVGTAVVLAVLYVVGARMEPGIIADKDSSYARYQVMEGQRLDGSTVRYLVMDNIGAQSGVIVGREKELIFEYTQGFKAVADTRPTTDSVLVIGGGAYTFPSVLALERPNSRVDVVEIDPALDAVATEYFGYTPRPNLTLIHEDGRVFLNRNTTQYDQVYIDAFSSLTPPYQLTTIQAAERMKAALTQDGVMIVNLIAEPNASDQYFTATMATYRAVFGDIAVLRVQPTSEVNARQNLLLVMGNEEAVREAQTLGYEVVKVPRGGSILTDDYAPVEQLIQASSQL